MAAQAEIPCFRSEAVPRDAQSADLARQGVGGEQYARAMRVMSTGGAGFLGGHTAAAFVAAGHEPHLLVRKFQKLGRLCALHDLDPNVVSFTVGDVRDADTVLAALDECQACIHTAASSRLALFRGDTASAGDRQIWGGRTLLETRQRARVTPLAFGKTCPVDTPLPVSIMPGSVALSAS